MKRTQTRNRYNAEKFVVYVEVTIEKAINVTAIDEEEAKELAINRISKHKSAFREYKMLEHEVVDIERL